MILIPGIVRRMSMDESKTFQIKPDQSDDDSDVSSTSNSNEPHGLINAAVAKLLHLHPLTEIGTEIYLRDRSPEVDVKETETRWSEDVANFSTTDNKASTSSRDENLSRRDIILKRVTHQDRNSTSSRTSMALIRGLSTVFFTQEPATDEGLITVIIGVSVFSVCLGLLYLVFTNFPPHCLIELLD